MDGEAIKSGRSHAYILVEKSEPLGGHHVKDIRNSSIHGADRIPSRAEMQFYTSARIRYFRCEPRTRVSSDCCPIRTLDVTSILPGANMTLWRRISKNRISGTHTQKPDQKLLKSFRIELLKPVSSDSGKIIAYKHGHTELLITRMIDP